MCGIIGYIINQKSEKKDFYKKKFFTSFQRQNHRGPDFKQEVNFNYKELKIQLGFNRLSIIDLDKSANKIFYNNQYYLLFNGEIYNFKKLKDDYLSNEKFSTKTDTEVLFKLLIKYGIDFLKKLQGIFAFTFLDIKKNKLYLARDFTGTKPLYFFKNNDGKIIHVGLVIAPNKILHASGMVRIDALDETGIFNKDLNKYTHFFSALKRIL